MSIADTGRFWEILVIPVLQILEDSGKYWLLQLALPRKALIMMKMKFVISLWKWPERVMTKNGNQKLKNT
jgi:hypothetical protein